MRSDIQYCTYDDSTEISLTARRRDPYDTLPPHLAAPTEFLAAAVETRFGPNRPAADMEGNVEFDFLVIYEDFWRVVEDFWRIVEEFWIFFRGFLENF